MKIGRLNPMPFRALVVLGVLAGSFSSLHAQSVARVRAEAVLSTATFRELEALATEAGRRGVPAELLYSKALEGAAKRVPPPLLMGVVRGYADRLATARQVFGAEAAPPMLVAGSDAIQRGVAPEVLRGLGEGGHHSAMAVLVLADLVETGVPSDNALRVLREAMSQRMNDQRMLQIPERVRGLMREGHSPMAAAERVWSRMHRGPGGMGGAGDS